MIYGDGQSLGLRGAQRRSAWPGPPLLYGLCLGLTRCRLNRCIRVARQGDGWMDGSHQGPMNCIEGRPVRLTLAVLYVGVAGCKPCMCHQASKGPVRLDKDCGRLCMAAEENLRGRIRVPPLFQKSTTFVSHSSAHMRCQPGTTSNCLLPTCTRHCPFLTLTSAAQ